MQENLSQKNPLWFNLFIWILLGIVVTIPFLAWGSFLDWDISRVGIYSVFPLLGIWAFSVMWTHYIISEVKLLLPDIVSPRIYKKFSLYLVLALILLHPGLFTYGQWSTNQGLPPDGWFSYVGEDFKLYIIIAVIAWLIFIFYEIFERLKNHPAIMKKWWLITAGNTIAMTFIFFHGLNIGTHLQSGFMNAVWLFYGASLFFIIIHIHKTDWDKYRAGKKS